MIEKFLIRFCASEVRVMIARMHERPEDFGYGSRWRDLAKAREGFTWAEQVVLNKEWVKFKKTQKRRELLSLITNEVVNPTSKDKWGLSSPGNFNHSTFYQQQLQHHQLDMQIQEQLAQYRQDVSKRLSGKHK
jgi:hypothetical protein